MKSGIAALSLFSKIINKKFTVYIFYTIYFAIVLHNYDILLYFNILYNFFNTGMEPAISILEIIFLHYVAKPFCEAIKFPKEMPKIAKCLKCLKLRNSIGFIKRKKQGM
jgi:hypothetical protein